MLRKYLCTALANSRCCNNIASTQQDFGAKSTLHGIEEAAVGFSTIEWPHLGFEPAPLQLSSGSAVVHGIIMAKHAAEEPHAVRVVQRMEALHRRRTFVCVSLQCTEVHEC